MILNKDKKIKKWTTFVFDNIIVTIHKTFTKIGQLYGLLKTYHEAKSKEMFLSALISIQLEEKFGNAVVNEAINGHGKTDIMICFDEGVKHIIECKIYNGVHSMQEIYQQINKHTTSYDTTASLIMFCESPNFQQAISNLEKWMNINSQLIDKPFKRYQKYQNIWKNNIRHDYGHVLNLHCACYHVYFDENHAKFDKTHSKTTKPN